MSEGTEYILGGTLTEQERLIAQAAGLTPEANMLLDAVDVRPGWRAIDFGCGPIGILPLLVERVGVAGKVVGLERESRFVKMARSIMAERGLENVEIVEADANASGLASDSFDFAHERLVILQQPNPQAILGEMVRVVRPGGIVATEDIDEVSWLCYPPHPAWNRLFQALLSLCAVWGVDPFIGRRLPSLLRSVGLIDVRAEVRLRLDQPGEYRRMQLLWLIESMRTPMAARGILPEADIAALMADLRRHLEDPETIVVREMLMQAWGRKPG
jgi:SAM-dependent methyltransferase